MITIRGLVGVLSVLLLVLSLSLTGCAGSCVDKQVKYYEKAPVTQTSSRIEQETYTYEQPDVELVCNGDFSHEVEYDDAFWLDEPVPGEPNQLKRTAYILNEEDERGKFAFDILYLEDGSVVERTLNPSETLVEANGRRRLFLVWNTEYAPGKDVRIDVIDAPQKGGIESCEKVVTYTNRTGVRNKTVTSESTSYENIIKVKTVKVCD